MLFDASPSYAPGQAHGDVPYTPQYQSMDLLGRFHLDQIKPYSLWVGLIGLVLVAYLLHRSAGRKAK
jgi:hypothetical protein